MSLSTPIRAPEYSSPTRSPPVKGQKKRKEREPQKWIQQQEFDSEQDAKTFILAKGDFAFSYGSRSTGSKVYRCKNIKARAVEQCSEKYRIVFLVNGKFRAEWNQEEHNCELLEHQCKAGLPDEVKDYIKTVVRAGRSGAKTLRNLMIIEKSQGRLLSAIPTVNEIKYFLKTIRNERPQGPKISLKDLENWCEANKNCPPDLDTPFVVGYSAHYGEVLDDPEKRFWFLVSTRRLMQLASECSTFTCDTTFKILYEGFPVPVLGTVDANKRFRTLCFGVTSNETTKCFTEMMEAIKRSTLEIFDHVMDPDFLIADGALEIRNSYTTVFPDRPIIMCWAHACRRMKERLDVSVKNNKLNQQIFADIHKIQLAQSTFVFEKAAQLFCKKHQRSAPDFIRYFNREWVDTRIGWHEGVAQMCPSTNNAQESIHNSIKRLFMMRQRVSMADMLQKSFDIIRCFSVEMNIDCPFASERDLNDDDWINAYIWNKEKDQTIVRDPDDKMDGDEENWYVPCSAEVKIDLDIINQIKECEWKTFDDFRRGNFKAHNVTIDKTEPLTSFCCCRSFFKDFKCVHALGMKIRLGYAKVSQDIKNKSIDKLKSTVPIGKKLKRGRPKKPARALIVDEVKPLFEEQPKASTTRNQVRSRRNAAKKQ